MKREADFLRRQGFKSLQEYVDWCHENTGTYFFKGAEYFHQLLELGIVEPGYKLRAMYTGGADHTYEITEDHMLEGFEMMAHSGKEGIFRPEDILSLENAPDGWFFDMIVPESFRKPLKK